ncbi:MAG: hypothetical protein ACYDCH_14010 [Gaiellaceae bacterium]
MAAGALFGVGVVFATAAASGDNTLRAATAQYTAGWLVLHRGSIATRVAAEGMAPRYADARFVFFRL